MRFLNALGFVAVWGCLWGTSAPGAETFDHSHAAFTAILETHVSGGLVDYRALQADPKELIAYLDTLATVSEPEFASWTESQQLAMLLNLYNAATLKLIVDHYPVSGIKEIGSLLRGPWDQPVVRLWGGTVTLNQVEHEIIRIRYPQVPEIHFALVCAALGCPPLRSEAYVPDRLEAQLENQRRVFLSDSAKNSIDGEARRLNLSPIFKWYGEDFVKAAGSVQAYLKAQWPEVTDAYALRYTKYDWSLNER